MWLQPKRALTRFYRAGSKGGTGPYRLPRLSCMRIKEALPTGSW